MEKIVLILFCLILTGFVATGTSIVYALLAGLILFLAYGRWKGFSASELFKMSLEGLKTTRNILITFMLIGILTALWRASGCIPSIVCYFSKLISPSIFILLIFLFNCAVSVLTGTSLGTAATMGVICMSIANSMQLPVFWVGGAIMSGIHFGDRCSPVSTSALLVSTVTGTDLYANIKGMIRTAVIPFILTCIIYIAVGFSVSAGSAALDVEEIFGSGFVISPACVVPAVSILVLACMRVKVKQTMLVSIVFAAAISVLVQKQDPLMLLKAAFIGYKAGTPELAAMINGGGIRSMIRVALIVGIASCYSGIFKKTGMLDFMKDIIRRLSVKIGSFRTVCLLSVLASAISCNQTLSIMLTSQLSEDIGEPKERMAIFLENTAVLIAPLIPWSVACNAAFTTVGAPTVCVLTSCFLYLMPIWHCIRNGKD